MTTPFWFFKNMEETRVNKQNPGDPRTAAPAPRRNGVAAEEKPLRPIFGSARRRYDHRRRQDGRPSLPGIAIAEEFLGDPANRVLFIGTERGLEKKILDGLGFPPPDAQGGRPEGAGSGSDSGLLLKIPGSLIASFRILRTFQPAVVVGVGGYASGPAVLAARLLGLKTAIAEQNAFPGLTNRILGRFADRIFVTFSASARWFPAGRTRVTGNPIRTAFLAEKPQREKGDPRFTLLIFGGSQGSHAINRIAMDALDSLGEMKERIRFIHQTGRRIGRRSKMATGNGASRQRLLRSSWTWQRLTGRPTCCCAGPARHPSRRSPPAGRRPFSSPSPSP